MSDKIITGKLCLLNASVTILRPVCKRRIKERQMWHIYI